MPKMGSWITRPLWSSLLVIGTMSSAFGDLLTNNVVVVLDSSGSMSSKMGTSSMKKMDAAKEALIEVLKQTPADTQIGLLVFSAKSSEEEWLYPLGPRDDERLIQAIRLPVPGYKTPLGEYIKKGADRLLKEREKQFGYGTYRLLIVTDGEADDPELVDRYVRDTRTRGVVIDAIGVDMDQAHTLATQVHSYRSANDPQSLKQAVSEVFAEVAGDASDGTALEFFELIAPLPDELAQGMLKALSAVDNSPVGRSEDPSSGQGPGTGVLPGSSSSSAQPGPKPFNVGRIVLLCFVALFLRSILKAGRGKGKRRR